MRASTPPTDDTQTPFVVVGLGASAGGLEALEAFFAGLPSMDSCAFVVVIHLAPDRESEMADILARTVPVPVVQVEDSVRVEAGHVYVIPPGKNLAMDDGHLRLSPLESARRERRPIDHFFRTLAYTYGDHAVAVVLSGTGQNGTVGIAAVKEAGGLVLAQDPDEAGFGEMPRSAIASGAVDHIDAASALGREVLDYSARLRTVHLSGDGAGEPPGDDVRAVQRVLAQVRARTGHDFSHYKRSTILRRLERRLHVVGDATLDAYVGRLRENGAEARALLGDLLISVTNFFRDPGPFAVFERTVVPALFEGKGPADTVRVWTAGCATGEETYSVAMLLAEHAATLDDPPPVQVFGTDLGDTGIAAAREGVYPGSIEADVSPERLRRFFRKDPHGYRVAPALREMVLFAPHNVLKDPPFSHVDAVTCRNVLIYLQRVLQERALGVFHYALNPGGFLFLGTSETADVLPDAYRTLDKSARIYQRRETTLSVPAVVPRTPREWPAATSPPAETSPSAPFSEFHARMRAEASPPSVLVSEAHDVVHLSEGAGVFLEMTGGEPTRNVVRLVRPELRIAVQTGLFQSQRQDRTVEAAPVRMTLDGELVQVTVRVRVSPEAGMAQISFEARPTSPEPPLPPSTDEAAALLAADLREVREQLQLTVEEFETSREELQSQNEELQSANEELRSTAEELETSKEEAQSMAEELRTVNDEMKASVDDLATAKGDLENLIVSTEIATLFLDRELRIKWFTPQIRTLFHVRSSDVGRPLADLAQKFGDTRLVEDAEAVLERLQVTEREIEDDGGRWHLVAVRPYRSVEDRIGGVVVTFVDITRRRAGEIALRASEARYRTLFASIDEGFALSEVVRDAAGAVTDVRYLEVNPAFEMLTGLSAETVVGKRASELFPVLEPAWLERYARVVDSDEAVRFEEHLEVLDRWFEVYAFPLGDGRFAGLFTDTTERRESAAALLAGAERAVFRATLADTLRPLTDPADVQGAAARVLGDHLGASRVHYAEFEADGVHAVVAQDYARGVPNRADRYAMDGFATLHAAARAGRTFVVDDVAGDTRLTPHERDVFGSLPVAAITVVPLVKDDVLHAVLAVHHDAPHGWTDEEVALVEETAERTWMATEQARAEVALRDSEAQYRTLFASIDEGFCVIEVLFDDDGAVVDYRYDEVNPAFESQSGLVDAVGRTMREMVPDHESHWFETYGRVANTGEPVRLVGEAQGLGRWFNVYAFPIGAPDGSCVAILFTDVSEQKRAESEIRALNADLEDRVAARTRQVRTLAARLAVAEQNERQRIAHILHDDLQQQLYGLSMVLSLLGRAPDPAAVTGLAERATAILDEAVEMARSLATELAPAILQAERLGEVLAWTAATQRETHGLDVAVEVTGDPRVTDPAMRILLYQSLREVLFNVVKHAGVTSARLVAWSEDDASARPARGRPCRRRRDGLRRRSRRGGRLRAVQRPRAPRPRRRPLRGRVDSGRWHAHHAGRPVWNGIPGFPLAHFCPPCRFVWDPRFAA